MIQHILDYRTFLIPEGMYRFKQAKLFFKKETRRVEFCSIDGKKFNCVAVSLCNRQYGVNQMKNTPSSIIQEKIFSN